MTIELYNADCLEKMKDIPDGSMELRVNFLDLFLEHPDGSLSPKHPIEINGVLFRPGVLFPKGVIFGGINFQLFKYKDVAVEEQEGGVKKIIGFYND